MTTEKKDWREHSLLIGPPGAGTTLWARQQSRKVPYREWDARLTDAEYLYRICGLQGQWDDSFRPLRAPHHSVSLAGVMGTVRKGWRVQPGELSLAHGGVLLLDEAAEFKPNVLEAVVTATLKGKTPVMLEGLQMLWLPSEFRLIAVALPCPCGWRGFERRGGNQCRCSDKQVDRYRACYAPLRSVCRELDPSEWMPDVTALKQEIERQRLEAEGKF